MKNKIGKFWATPPIVFRPFSKSHTPDCGVHHQHADLFSPPSSTHILSNPLTSINRYFLDGPPYCFPPFFKKPRSRLWCASASGYADFFCPLAAPIFLKTLWNIIICNFWSTPPIVFVLSQKATLQIVVCTSVRVCRRFFFAP